MRELFDFVLSFATVIGSSSNDQTQATQLSLSGIGPIPGIDQEADLTDESGERPDDQDTFGQLGVLCRPLDPETIDRREYRTEVLSARTSDGVIPFAFRDLRLFRFFSNGIPKGAVRLSGYGGGFSTFDVKDLSANAASRTNINVTYIPYDFQNGVPQKAHAIVVDPDPANGISLTHGDGYQTAITDDGILNRTPDENTYTQLKEGEFTVSAAKITLKGSCYLGISAESAVPLLPGAASPPGPSVFISPA